MINGFTWTVALLALSISLAAMASAPDCCRQGLETGMNTVEEQAMPSTSDGPSRSSSRTRPPEVEPISHRGVRYEQLRGAAAQGYEPHHGYLVATDEASGQRLWVSKVYAVEIDPNRETDVQVVFFRHMELDPDNQRLLIENERGRRFSVDLRDGSAMPLD